MRRNRYITWDDYQALHDGMKLPKAVAWKFAPTAKCGWAHSRSTT